jgi:hypothetical protein
MTRSGRATIDIVGDVSKFAATLKRDLDQAIKGVKVDTRPVGKQITDGIGDALDEVGDLEIDAELRGEARTLAGLRTIRAALDEVGDEAKETERKMRAATDSGTTGAGFLSKALSSVGVAVTSIGSALVGLGASAPTPAGIVAIGAALLGLAAATPVVLALGAALADLAGLAVVLPGVVGVAAATMIAFKLALHGVSDAIEAVLDGDPEKIAEAMRKLAPAARAVVGEFRKLLPSLRGTQRLLQQDFFAPLEGALTRLAKRALPTVRVGLAGIATELGELGAELLRILGGAQSLGFLRGVFTSAKAVIDRVTDSVDSLLNIVFRVGSAGLPLIRKFVDWMFDGVDALSTFLSSAEGKTALQDFLGDAVSTLKDLAGLTRALGGLFGAMFGDADDEGRTFIQTLTEMVDGLAAFFRSAEGQEFLQNILDALPLVTDALGGLFAMVALGGQAVNNFVEGWNAVAARLASLPGDIAATAAAVGGGFVDAWNTASAAVGAFFAAVGQWFAGLPAMIWGWIQAAAAALSGGFAAAFNAGLLAVGVGIGLILFAVTQLPGLIWAALQRLPGLVVALFAAAWNAARSLSVSAFHAIVAFTVSFVARSVAALQSMPGRLRAIFAAALSAARATVISGFNSIVAFAASVPGRLAGLAGRFLSAGRSIIAGFMRGLSSASGFAGNVGSAIVGAIRSGLNGVIGRINAGIASIDSKLPGSLPRIPSLATGGVLLDDTLIQAHARELVLPLGDRRAVDMLAAAMRRADDTGGSTAAAPVRAGDVEVRVFIGDRELTDIVDVQISERDRDVRRRVLAGAG